MAVENAVRSPRVLTVDGSPSNTSTPMSRNSCSVNGSMARVDGRGNDGVEGADDTIVEQQEAVASGGLGVPVVMNGAETRQEPPWVLGCRSGKRDQSVSKGRV
jgi:hypothetical protein